MFVLKVGPLTFAMFSTKLLPMAGLTVFALMGSVAIPAMRPLTGAGAPMLGIPGIPPMPLMIGAGPTAVQDVAEIGRLYERSTRSSSASNMSRGNILPRRQSVLRELRL